MSTLWSLTLQSKNELPILESNLGSPEQFENRIKPHEYVRHITRCTMYIKLHFVSQNWRKENQI